MSSPEEVAVSIAMATFNGSRFVALQIQSLLSQMQPRDELVIVDDCSTDGTSALLQRIQEQTRQVHVYRNRSNQGVVQSFSRALSKTRSDIVFLCDQDDLWVAGKRRAFVECFMQNPGCTIVVSDAQLIDENGASISASFMETRGGFRPGLMATLVKNRYIGCCMAVRRNVLDLGLPIPLGAPMHDMWLGVLGNAIGEVVYLPQPYLLYRRHHANTARRGTITQMVRWRLSLFFATRLRLWQRSRKAV